MEEEDAKRFSYFVKIGKKVSERWEKARIFVLDYSFKTFIFK